MSQLNKKNGNLRGVTFSYALLNESGDRDYNEHWHTRLPVQGWTIWSNQKHRFNINFNVENHDIEVNFSAEALVNMLDAINEEQEPILLSEKAGILNLNKNCGCTVDGCPCNSGD